MRNLSKKAKVIIVAIALCLLANVALTIIDPGYPGVVGLLQTLTGDRWTSSSHSETITLDNIPEFDGNAAYIAVNGNVPFFDESDMTTEPFETYSELDSLGRCGTAYANICKELMPAEDRGSISGVKPSGWGHNNTYSFVDGGYIWNRCHLIGFQLAGENANEKNLITGTRYLNIEGMLDLENMVADYVRETNNHVLYRVTPIYEGQNLIADGVLMEARSVEDQGKGICYNVYAYNCQPGVEINYVTGDNWAVDGDTTHSSGSSEENVQVENGGFWSLFD